MTTKAYIDPSAGPLRMRPTAPVPALPVAWAIVTKGMLLHKVTPSEALPLLGMRLAPLSTVVPSIPPPSMGRLKTVYFPAVYSRARIKRPLYGQLWPRTR